MDIAEFARLVAPERFASNSAVRREIKSLRINGVQVEDPFAEFYSVRLGDHAIGVLLERGGTVISAFLGTFVLRRKEPFEGWQ